MCVMLVTLVKRAMGQIVQGAGLGDASLLYAFPILFSPQWLPATWGGVQTLAAESKKLALKMRDVPIAAIQKRMVRPILITKYRQLLATAHFTDKQFPRHK